MLNSPKVHQKINSRRSSREVIILKALLFCLSCAVVLAVSSSFTFSGDTGWHGIVHPALATLGAFLLTLVFMRWQKLKLWEIGLQPNRQSLSSLVIGFFIGLVLVGAHLLLSLVAGHFSLHLSPEINYSHIVLQLLIYLILATREEISFHAYPLSSLNSALGAWPAQIVIALIFAVEHRIGGLHWPAALLGAGIGSLFFGYAALKTKGIAVPIGLHTAWNFGEWLIGFKDDSGMLKATVDKGYSTYIENAALVSYWVVLALGITLLNKLTFFNREKIIRWR